LQKQESTIAKEESTIVRFPPTYNTKQTPPLEVAKPNVKLLAANACALNKK
jgi:hypothetical protein